MALNKPKKRKKRKSMKKKFLNLNIDVDDDESQGAQRSPLQLSNMSQSPQDQIIEYEEFNPDGDGTQFGGSDDKS